MPQGVGYDQPIGQGNIDISNLASGISAQEVMAILQKHGVPPTNENVQRLQMALYADPSNQRQMFVGDGAGAPVTPSDGQGTAPPVPDAPVPNAIEQQINQQVDAPPPQAPVQGPPIQPSVPGNDESQRPLPPQADKLPTDVATDDGAPNVSPDGGFLRDMPWLMPAILAAKGTEVAVRKGRPSINAEEVPIGSRDLDIHRQGAGAGGVQQIEGAPPKQIEGPNKQITNEFQERIVPKRAPGTLKEPPTTDRPIPPDQVLTDTARVPPEGVPTNAKYIPPKIAGGRGMWTFPRAPVNGVETFGVIFDGGPQDPLGSKIMHFAVVDGDSLLKCKVVSLYLRRRGTKVL